MSNESTGPAPCRELPGGGRMPIIGLGTFGSDHAAPESIAEAVRGAYEAGYRHFDCAAVYANEAAIGKVFRQLLGSGVKREELWVTSKVWNDMHGRVEEACRQTLADLQLEQLDLYLVHWPFPNWHPPGCTVEARSEDAKPYIHADYMKTWRQMERLVELGLTRYIGVSNMTIPKLRRMLPEARIRPVAHQFELHPHLQQPELFDYVVASGMIPVGYCPLGSPNRPERDKTPEDTEPMQDPVIVEIARSHGIHPAAVCLKWAVQRGQVTIPMSTKPEKYVANLRAVCGEPLTAEEMQRIAGIDRNCRMVKGQVFLWKPGQSWEDLWDVNGEITPA